MAVTVEIPVSLRNARFHGPCEVGAFTYFNGAAEVFHASIGRYCSIAPGVTIGPGEHVLDRLSTHPFATGGGGNRFKRSAAYAAIRTADRSDGTDKKTTIGADVWLGTYAIIKQGVTIGPGSIVAANAVVTKDVAPYTIVGGVPARCIRSRFEPAWVSRLLALAWWEYSMAREHVGVLPYTEIEATVAQLEHLKAQGRLVTAQFKQKKVAGRWYQRLFS